MKKRELFYPAGILACCGSAGYDFSQTAGWAGAFCLACSVIVGFSWLVFRDVR